MKHLFKLLFLITLFASCGGNGVEEIFTIRSGVSFGECTGYCIDYNELGPHVFSRIKTSYDEEQFPKMTCNKSSEPWSDITSSVDIDGFFQLSQTIGCPDCNDGGAAFLEITTNDRLHMVVYEYDNPPKDLEDILTMISIFTIELEDCF